MNAKEISQLVWDCRKPLLKENQALRERIEELENRLIVAWHHSNPEPGTLAEFLAMSDAQYAVWVRTAFFKEAVSNPPDSTAPRTPGSDSEPQ